MKHLLPVIFAVLVLFPACAPTAKPKPEAVSYILEYPPPPTSAKTRLPDVIRILPFSAAPALAGRTILYRDHANQRRSYHYHRWLTEPARAVEFFLQRDLAASGLFAGAMPATSPVAHTCSLVGTVNEFLEDETDEPWRAVLELTIQLLDRDYPARVLLQKTYRTSEPLARHHPRALAAAMSVAMARLSAAISNDIYTLLTAGTDHVADKNPPQEIDQ